jgi:uncharacterized protein (DUF58 family)
VSVKTWAPILAVAFLGGITSGNTALIVISLAVALVLGLAEFWRRQALTGVHYQRRFQYLRGFPGEQTDVRIAIENRKHLPLTWLRLADLWPAAANPVDESLVAPSAVVDRNILTALYSLAGRQRITRAFAIRFRQRGVYTVGPAEITSGDPFGIFQASRQLPGAATLTVFPRILPLEAIQLSAQDPFGDQAARKRLFEDPNRPVGIRAYHPEDDFRRVHWAATARTGSLQVKVYQAVTSQVMMVYLNVATASQYWLGTRRDLLEQLISIAATLAYHGIQDGYAVGLVSNGALAHADRPFHIPPGRSPAQLSTLLEALAAVTPYTTAPFEEYLVRTLPQVSYGATLVVVTSLVSPALVETLLRLKRYRAHTTLISLAAAAPPDLPGIRTLHLPFDAV